MSAQMIALSTLVRKETARIFHIWSQTIIPPMITMGLYFIIFGNFVGRFIDRMHGFDYVTFIAPGLIMMSAITATYINVSSSLYLEKFQRSFDALIVAPVCNEVILCGYVFGGVLRGLIVSVAVGATALFFTHLHLVHIFILLPGLLLILLLLSLAGFINGLLAESWDSISLIPTFVLTPLTYLGGVFFSLDALSSLWRTALLFNPVVYMINIFRYGMLGFSDVNIPVAFLVLIVCDIALYLLAINLLRRGVGVKA